MGFSLSSEQEDGSTISFIERGLQCVRQGHYSEGVTFFALARERLSPEQSRLAAVLDTFIQGYVQYWQAEQTLHQASMHFAEINAEQQAQITALEMSLLALIQDEDADRRDGTLHALPGRPQGIQIQDSELHQPAQALLLSARSEVNGSAIAQPGGESEVLPALHFTCFGRFEIKRLGQPVTLCPNRNGQAILRYLVAQPGHRATIDMLLEVFWPEEEPEVAQHKLQVAVSALRRSLNRGYASDAGGGYILCKNRAYQLNPLVSFRSDVDDFLKFYQAGRQTNGSAMAANYERACELYTGPFLSEDLYSDWSSVRREQLSETYIAMGTVLAEHYLEAERYEEAVKWATAVLKENRCDEGAHRQLMRAYAASGRRSEALRQYQRCEHILAEELGVQPMSETVNLFHSILGNEKFLKNGTRIERE